MAIRKINGLPLFKAELNKENDGVLRVSLVDLPAVESDFKAYAAQGEAVTYAVKDAEKMRVLGVVLRANYAIYRETTDGRGYYIVFQPDEIRAFAQKYLTQGRTGEVDLHHDFKSIEGCEPVQFFIKDTAAGISPAGFEGIADGSLFAEYQVTDADLWERIKAGEFKGFSVEIIHTETPVEIGTHSKKNYMSKFSKIKAALAALVSEVASVAEYGRMATDKGTIIWDGEDELAEGVVIWSEDEDGQRVELEDGDYIAGEQIISIEGGAVKAIAEKPAEPEQPESPAEPEADEKDKRIAELEAAMAAMKAENEELKARLADAQQKLSQPAAASAHDAFKSQQPAASSKPAGNFINEFKRFCK